MKILVISDIHDDKDKLSLVLKQAASYNPAMIFALGDYTSLDTFKIIAKTNLPIIAVFGNMDREQEKTETWVKESNNKITLRREMNRVQLQKKNVALTHFPEIAKKLLKSGMYDAVFFGHTHQAEQNTIENTLVANPGAVKEASYGIYNVDTNEFNIYSIQP